MNDTSASLTPLQLPEDLEHLEADWQRLADRTGANSFLRWSWIGAWLKTLAQDATCYLFKVTRGDSIEALAVLVHYRYRRRLFFRVDRFSIHETGQAHRHAVIENNGVLCDPRDQSAVLAALVETLESSGMEWNEITIPASAYEQSAFSEVSHPLVCEDVFVSRHTELPASQSYLKSKVLSKNRRWQIRRSERFYSELYGGEPEISVAGSVDQALEWFEKMGLLHTKYWLGRQRCGSFLIRPWVEFHRQLIEDGWLGGEVQLLRVAANGRDIGYLYNLIANGRCSNIQSGFNYEPDNRAKPGLMSHALAVQYNLNLGNTVYDFLMGDSPYKESMSNRSAKVTTWSIQRPSFQQIIEKFLLSLVRRIRGV